MRRFPVIPLILLVGAFLACGTTSSLSGSTSSQSATATPVTALTSPTPVNTAAMATPTQAPPTATPISTQPTATPVPPSPTPTMVIPTPVPWDTHPFFEANPDCVRDGAHWTYFNNGTKGTMTCTGRGVRLTPLSTINFSGVTGNLPPHMTISVYVYGMTPNAVASIILYLNGGSDGNSHEYYFDLSSTGQWTMRRYHPETIIASGSIAATTAATLTASSSGSTRTFSINGTTVGSINDGITFSAASSSAISLGGTSTDSAVFENFHFTP